jgi:hypothetical protein
MFFLRPDADITSLLALCNLPSKSEVEKYCRSLVIRPHDFTSFVVYGREGCFDPPYRYASAFRDRQPPHLIPTDEERAGIGASRVGQPLQDKGRKALYKMVQMLQERKQLAAHLFYTFNLAHWSLFYFDQRDTQVAANHWEHGPHLHYVSSAWLPLDAETVYQQVTHGRYRFPAVHIRVLGGF